MSNYHAITLATGQLTVGNLPVMLLLVVNLGDGTINLLVHLLIFLILPLLILLLIIRQVLLQARPGRQANNRTTHGTAL